MLIDVVWLALLALIAFGLASKWNVLTVIHDPFAGVVPFVVPWAGALGGVGISLVGIAGHQIDWDAAQYAYWHLVRPLLGLLFGTVAVLVIILLLDTVKVTQTSQGRYTPTGAAILAVIAFVVGYREATFRTLVTRVVDLVIGPATAGAAGTLALVPSAIDFGSVTPGGTAQRATHLFNGSSDTLHVTQTAVVFGDPSVSITAFAAQDLKPNDSLRLELTWNAPAGGVAGSPKLLDTTLRVTVGNVLVSARLRGTSP
jgi:hypothetical protein